MAILPLGLRTILASILTLSLLVIYLCTPSYRSVASPSSEDAKAFGLSHIPGFRTTNLEAALMTGTAMNDTLGFQEILMISMDYRTDRQDALALMAAETGLKFKLIPGVRGRGLSWSSFASITVLYCIAWLLLRMLVYDEGED